MAQVVEQLQDRRLHRDVEGGDRLVGDEQARLDGQGPRDGDALALSAGELVRVAVEGLGRHADQAHQLAAAGLDLVARHQLVHAQQLGQHLAHGQARVEGRGRILEHHLHRAPLLGGPAAGRGTSRRGASGRCRATTWPVMQRPMVVLPQPDSPDQPDDLAGSDVSDTPSTARTTP